MEIGQGALFRDSIPEHLVRSGSLPVVPKPLSRFEKRKIQFNQNAFDKSGCTYTACMTITANNRNIDRTQADIQRFLDHKKDYGRTGKGMYMDKACDMVCDRLNMLYPDQGRTSYMLNFYTERDTYLNKGHMLQIGSMINEKYIEEISDGGIEAPRGKTGIGHVRSIFAHTAYVGNGLVENFLGVLPFNVIDIIKEKPLLDATQFYFTSFIIYPSGKMPVPVKYPYMTVAQADQLEKQYPTLFTPSFSETVRAWVDLAEQGEDVYGEFVNFTGIDGVMKMMICLDKYREAKPGVTITVQPT